MLARPMTKRRLYTSSLLLLLATAPWPFWGQDTGVVLGLPPWALYSLLATALYALLVAHFLKRYWDLSAQPPDEAGRGEAGPD
jgi:hypothetical protein